MNLSFIGLGAMGYPMAGHLSNSGFNVNVFNRTTAKSAAWADAYKGSVHPSPAKAANNCDAVLLCVGNDDDVRSVVFGDEGALGQMKPGSYLIDHTTASSELAKELHAACTDRNVHFLDAPVSGGQAGAENGKINRYGRWTSGTLSTHYPDP